MKGMTRSFSQEADFHLTAATGSTTAARFQVGKSSTALAIGPHPDDVEIGCFGALAAYAAHGYAVHVLVLTDGARGGDPIQRREETLRSAELIDAQVHFGGLADCEVRDSVDTVLLIEQVLATVQPSVVFGPSAKDTHPDHRHTAMAAAAAMRRQPDQILIYQTPTTTLDFMPTYHMDVSDYYDVKRSAVLAHASQSSRYYTASQALDALAVYRGLQIGSASGFYEAFEVQRFIHRWHPCSRAGVL
jgi:LmbE family N-acetylglucosaminyl deacetylase